MDDLLHARTALEAAARGFDPSACSGDDAIAIVKEIGSIRRLADGVLGKAAKRVEDTAAYTYKNDRNAAELCQRLTGVSTGEAKRAIDGGREAGVVARDGRGDPRRDVVVATGRSDCCRRRRRSVRGSCSCFGLRRRGIVPLRDKCIAVRAAREDQARASRSGCMRQRSFRMWPTADGMVEGHFKVTPEVGGAIKAVIEDGTRRKFRAARTAKVQESQDAYAADTFAEAVTGDPATRKSGGFTTHVIVDHEALLRGNTLAGRDV